MFVHGSQSTFRLNNTQIEAFTQGLTLYFDGAGKGDPNHTGWKIAIEGLVTPKFNRWVQGQNNIHDSLRPRASFEWKFLPGAPGPEDPWDDSAVYRGTAKLENIKVTAHVEEVARFKITLADVKLDLLSDKA